MLGPGAPQGGRFACEVRPGRIDDRQPVATPHQTDPETRQLFMESLPRPKPIEVRGIANASPRPSRETLEAVMRLEVARPVAQSGALGAVDSPESKLFLEDARKRLIGVDGLVRVMDLERLGMNLIHRYMEMLVLLFAVSHRDVLVFLKPRSLDRAAHDVLKLGGRQASILRMERDDEMVGPVFLGPHIALLEQLHDLHRKLGILAAMKTAEVSGHVPGASLFTFSSKHVGDEVRQTRDRVLIPRLFGRDDHRARTRCAMTRRSSAALRVWK